MLFYLVSPKIISQVHSHGRETLLIRLMLKPVGLPLNIYIN